MSSEHQIQAAVIRWRDAMFAATGDYRYRLLFAIPNGGARNNITGARLKREGVRAGMPDLCLPLKNKPVLFIEMKTQRGRVSKVQNETMADLERAGHVVTVCRSAQQAIELIEGWLR